LAVVVVALAHESAVLDEATDLIQETALATAGAKTGAKVGAKVAETVAVANKAGAKAGAKVSDKVGDKSKAEATVTIGTHTLNAAKVSMARSRLRKITMKLGVRHPVFLGEAAGLQDFASENAKYVKKGYIKLKDVLKKIDEFEGELWTEKENAVNTREELYMERTARDANFISDTDDRNKVIADTAKTMDTDKTQIGTWKTEIATLLGEENTRANDISASLGRVAGYYAAHWEAAETRHVVRNVLMQALWLVCTGFRSFRHTEYCTNLRRQPDYDEMEDLDATGRRLWECEKDTDGTASCTGVNADKLLEDVKGSDTFGNTMQPVWEQQKLADAEAGSVNTFDGDVDMEKGFVNNKAPWGVDPASGATGDTNGDGAPAEEELGESNKDGDTAKDGTHLMTSQEMSARLAFLLENTQVPERIQAPLTALIQAFDSDDAAVQGGLVEALVNLDTEEGESQSSDDHKYYKDMIYERQFMWDNVNTALNRKETQIERTGKIDDLVGSMRTNMDDEIAAHKSWRDHVASIDTAVDNSEDDIIQQEALIDACNEELTNVMRLNSLLRFLVVGDEAKCEGACVGKCDDPVRGTWTWRNRGQKQNENDSDDVALAGPAECEDMTGQDVVCDYRGSYPGDAANPLQPTRAAQISYKKPKYGHLTAPADLHVLAFCACEFSFFASDNSEVDCDLTMCPGFGKILYPGTNNALEFEGNPLWVTSIGGQVDATFDTATGRITQYEADAVCSGRPLEPFGVCNTVATDTHDAGTCSGCRDTVTGDPGTTEYWTELDGEAKKIKDDCRRSMPYSGTAGKCEMWTVPKVSVGADGYSFTWASAAPTELCSGKGLPKKDTRGQSTGTCVCNAVILDGERSYGFACEYRKCATKDDWYEGESAAVCYGRGTCTTLQDTLHSLGSCQCDDYSYGPECDQRRCQGYNPADAIASMTLEGEECGVGLGTCNQLAGRCQCAAGTSCGIPGKNNECPGACVYNKCQSDCQGADSDGGDKGKCDRYSGYCMCAPSKVLNGPDCQEPCRIDDAVSQANRNGQGPGVFYWGYSFDRWGWSLCGEGMLMKGLGVDKIGTMDALYNIELGYCAKPGENNMVLDRAIEKYRCYHENWWKKFDTRGGKFCRRNYFLAGLFRSHCNSLYCIEMAKCCNVKRSIWTDCKWTTNDMWNTEAKGRLLVDTTDSFAVGFFRTGTHTLSGLTHIRQCVPIWWGQIVSYKTRFD
jgi:hypothetical protein